MWRSHIDYDVLIVVIACCQICSIVCPPVFNRTAELFGNNAAGKSPPRRREIEDVSDLVKLYRQARKIQSFRRSPSIGPDLGFGNRLNAGNDLARFQIHVYNLTGPHSPGKRTLFTQSWK